MIPLLKILSDFRLYTGKDILPPTHTINSSRTGHLFVLESAPITSVLGPLFTVPSAQRAPPLGLPCHSAFSSNATSSGGLLRSRISHCTPIPMDFLLFLYILFLHCICNQLKFSYSPLCLCTVYSGPWECKFPESKLGSESPKAQTSAQSLGWEFAGPTSKPGHPCPTLSLVFPSLHHLLPTV